jgi:hypothetical protein
VEFQIQNEHMRIGYLHAQISDAQISDATVTIDESANQTIDIAALRFGIGKTGVQLRFYKKKEFDKLPADQRNELKAWRQTPEGKAATARDRAQKGESQWWQAFSNERWKNICRCLRKGTEETCPAIY